MSEGITFDVIGITEFMAAAAALDTDLAAALSTAGLAGAVPIETDWKNRVQETAFATGNYLRSIHSQVVDVNDEEVHIEIGTDIVDPPYPFYLEYGTRFMDARPTMTPAFETMKDAAVEEIGTVLKLILARHGGI